MTAQPGDAKPKPGLTATTSQTKTKQAWLPPEGGRRAGPGPGPRQGLQPPSPTTRLGLPLADPAGQASRLQPGAAGRPPHRAQRRPGRAKAQQRQRGRGASGGDRRALTRPRAQELTPDSAAAASRLGPHLTATSLSQASRHAFPASGLFSMPQLRTFQNPHQIRLHCLSPSWTAQGPHKGPEDPRTRAPPNPSWSPAQTT